MMRCNHYGRRTPGTGTGTGRRRQRRNGQMDKWTLRRVRVLYFAECYTGIGTASTHGCTGARARMRNQD